MPIGIESGHIKALVSQREANRDQGRRSRLGRLPRAGQGGLVGSLNEPSATQAEHQVQRRFLLDVVVGEGAAVLELLAREDQALLVRRDALLVLLFT